MIDWLLQIVPEKYRRDIVLIALAGSVAWVAFGLNSRLDAAEATVDRVKQNEASIVQIRNDNAVIKQQVSDINSNVALLVTIVAGQQAVVHHEAPKPHQ